MHRELSVSDQVEIWVRANKKVGKVAAPDRSTRRGRRDATLLATLYDSAARASELAGLTVGDIRVQPPPLAVLAAKAARSATSRSAATPPRC